MNILFASSEAYPFAVSGGLADVSGALPKELCRLGADCRVIMPLYGSIKEKFNQKLTFLGETTVPLGWRRQYLGIFTATEGDVTYYFLDNEYYFKREGLYGYFDDGERFAFFSHAVLIAIPYLNFSPDILHCNDWQTALIPVFKNCLYGEKYKNLRTVFSIHNIQYQGRFEKGFFYDVLGLDGRFLGLLEHGESLNLLKGAVIAADRILTVSETYAGEILEPYFAYGLSDFLRSQKFKLSGILNGIDFDLYNPEKDPFLKANFSVREIENKEKSKKHLRKICNLEQGENVPIIASVSRLAEHKGFDLIKCVFDEILSLGVQFVLLGSGEKALEDFFRYKAAQYPDRVFVNIGFNEKLAHKIYAGADIFLMPSKTEPCGLSQMIALRYGTVPIVRETGGLKDTVFEGENGNGFTFKNYNAHEMLYSVERAVKLYKENKAWKALKLRCMSKDNSWNLSAKKYLEVYFSLQ